MKVCMLTYSFYENDNRVMRYAHTLVDRGDEVDVIALRKANQSNFEIVDRVHVYRIQTRELNEKGKIAYLVRLIRFLFVSSMVLSKKHIKKPYDLIHVHSLPDFEIFAAWLPKLMGSRVILDIHDLVPEFYCSKFNTNGCSLSSHVLRLLEKASIRFSNHVIISNHIWAERITSRSVSQDRCSVILNYPDPSMFSPKIRTRNDDKFIIMYPGTLNWHQGLDIAIKALAIIKDEVPSVELHIYGRGSELDELESMVDTVGLRDRVIFKPLLPIDKIAEVMAEADIGVIPKRNDSFGGEAFSTKILEFMSLGVPVIVSRTQIDQYYFNDDVVSFFTPEDENDLAKSMLTLIQDKSKREKQGERALTFVKSLRWDKNKYKYLNLIDSLVKKL